MPTEPVGIHECVKLEKRAQLSKSANSDAEIPSRVGCRIDMGKTVQREVGEILQ